MARKSGAWLLALIGIVALLAGWAWWMGAVTVSGHIYAIGVSIGGLVLLWASSKVHRSATETISRVVEPMTDAGKHQSSDSKPGI